LTIKWASHKFKWCDSTKLASINAFMGKKYSYSLHWNWNCQEYFSSITILSFLWYTTCEWLIHIIFENMISNWKFSIDFVFVIAKIEFIRFMEFFWYDTWVWWIASRFFWGIYWVHWIRIMIWFRNWVWNLNWIFNNGLLCVSTSSLNLQIFQIFIAKDLELFSSICYWFVSDQDS
jgi:hypothetical protein